MELDGKALEALWQAEGARGYSGRGMYGKGCLGVVAEDVGEALARAAEALAEVAEEEGHGVPGFARLLAQLMREARWDGMGLGVVVYWENLPPPPEEEEGAWAG
ncbi:hypothetical protein HRbin39_00123 [bacterium HR39]|nr:hypothetical protein HRbin39_00123 [bacterium HR39]